MENKKNYGWKGFFPLLTFLAIYLGGGLIFTALGYGGDSFKQIPVWRLLWAPCWYAW